MNKEVTGKSRNMTVLVLLVVVAYFRYKLQCLVLSSLCSFVLSNSCFLLAIVIGKGKWKS